MTSQSCLYSSVKLQKRRNYNERAHASVHAYEYRDNALPPRVLTYFFSVFCIILTNISNVKITQVRHCCANRPWFDSTLRHYFILFSSYILFCLFFIEKLRHILQLKYYIIIAT